METNTRKIYNKVERVIRSCVSHEQLINALNYLKLFIDKFHSEVRWDEIEGLHDAVIFSKYAGDGIAVCVFHQEIYHAYFKHDKNYKKHI